MDVTRVLPAATVAIPRMLAQTSKWYTVSSAFVSSQQVVLLAFSFSFSSFHCAMSLLDLPKELLSRVCRFTGLNHQTRKYENKDFHSLRLTCRELYKRTTYDAIIRYGPMLRVLRIKFTYPSLCRVLQIVKIEEFRDRIVALELDPYASHDFDHILKPSSPLHPGDEERDMFIDSSEAVLLLTECFRWLAKAKRLVQVQHSRSASIHVSLAALVEAQFPVQLDIVYASPRDLISPPGHGDFGRSPAIYVPYIRCISTDGGVPGVLDYDEELIRELGEDKNEVGIHIKNYRLRQPAVASFWFGLRDIEHLHISGCICEPYLRFCNACNDTFIHIFQVAFNHLTAFHLFCMYVSGGRLRRWLREQGHTLTQLQFSNNVLTDGSWKTIAQGLQKLPFLRHLALEHDLLQKGAVPRPLGQQIPVYQCEDSEDDDAGVSKVRHYLAFFIENFCTERYTGTRYLPWPLPHYYKVDLPIFSLAYGPENIDCDPAIQALEKYIVEVEGE